MILFLSKEEIAELTGRKQRQKQVEQLTVMRITFTLDAFGWPKVLRKSIEAELGASPNQRNSNNSSIFKYTELNLED